MYRKSTIATDKKFVTFKKLFSKQFPFSNRLGFEVVTLLVWAPSPTSSTFEPSTSDKRPRQRRRPRQHRDRAWTTTARTWRLKLWRPSPWRRNLWRKLVTMISSSKPELFWSVEQVVSPYPHEEIKARNVNLFNYIHILHNYSHTPLNDALTVRN